ncbi:MAG: phosphoribosylformylglycinamidine cyclo-ligase [Candidatus Heimdallarchaeota archaeon]|nr:phosphoribosylformylglycinamidine cyclo-ligase [Candidatus Heimdallarchaeota archaeon]
MVTDKPHSYSEAGVDRELEEEAVKTILSMVRSTYKFGGDAMPEGHYAGSIPFLDYYLSLATDGVGTKILLALELNKLDTIGIDCVAMNVNDLIAVNSVPAAFVDYIAIKIPDKTIISEIMKGLTEGCIESEIPLIGGETAIVPELLSGEGNELDLSGTALGIQKKDKLITGTDISVGDIIIGIESSGVHSNGLTLARKLAASDELKEKLLAPTRIYVKMIKDLLKNDENFNAVHGMAHITGGGFTNLSRLGDFHYKLSLPDLPEIFIKLQQEGDLEDREMYRTFNCGIGFVLIVNPKYTKQILEKINDYFPAQIIGSVESGNAVTVNDLNIS